jgi:hypothetical protein
MDALVEAHVREVLAGVALPAEKAGLLEHAVRMHAEPSLLSALRSLPDLEFDSIEKVVERLSASS